VFKQVIAPAQPGKAGINELLTNRHYDE